MTTNHPTERPQALAVELAERLEQLGMSKRELSRRTGLSRMTIHNIINEGATNLKPTTFDAIDDTLRWGKGRAFALALGKGTPRELEDRVREYLARIAFHLSTMSSEDLELTLIMMQEHQLGADVITTDDFINRVGGLIDDTLNRIKGWETSQPNGKGT